MIQLMAPINVSVLEQHSLKNSVRLRILLGGQVYVGERKRRKQKGECISKKELLFQIAVRVWGSFEKRKKKEKEKGKEIKIEDWEKTNLNSKKGSRKERKKMQFSVFSENYFWFEIPCSFFSLVWKWAFVVFRVPFVLVFFFGSYFLFGEWESSHSWNILDNEEMECKLDKAERERERGRVLRHVTYIFLHRECTSSANSPKSWFHSRNSARHLQWSKKAEAFDKK